MNAGTAGADLPDLRVVRMERIVLHEEADDRRVQLLKQRLSVEQVVKNPPVVTPLGESRFVVLDGANRTSALRSLGVPDVVVQVVDYADVELSTWYHLVAGVDPEELAGSIRQSAGSGLEPVSLADARSRLAAGAIVAYFVEADGTVLAAFDPVTGAAPPDSTSERLIGGVALLKRIVATYKGHADIYRVQSDEIDTLRPFYSEIAALVVFPEYSPQDILELADRDVKLPTGITRHVIPRRALRTNTELGFLWSDTVLSEKNRWLSEWTRHKLQRGEIRYYQESTFLYDE